MRSKREVRYVVSRLKDPSDPESARELIGYHPFLDLAKKHADRIGSCACVDAQGGTYFTDGPYRRREEWQVEWTNRNLYRGTSRKHPSPEVGD